MNRSLLWLVLNDGVNERVAGTDIDSIEEAAVIARVLVPLTDCEVGRPRGRNSEYTVLGDVSENYAYLRLFDENAPLADIAVCLHSRAARGLWARVTSDGHDLVDINRPDPPWCAVRCYAPEEILPQWFDIWTKTVGMALVRREGW